MRNRLILIGVAIAVLIANAVPAGAQEFDLWFTNPNLFLPFSPPEKAHRPLASADEVSLTYCGSTLWSGMIDVVVVDTLAYCAMYSGLMIFDVSDPTAPRVVSKVYLTEGFATDLKVQGDYVYLTEWNGGESEGVLYAVNVANPSAPFVAGSYSTPRSAYGVDVAGDLAYVVYGLCWAEKGLLILNISNPVNITLDADLPVDVDNGLLKVRVRGGYAYAVGGGCLLVIDISDPAEPDSLSQYPTGFPEFYPLNLDVRQGDTLVYLADSDLMRPASRSAFTILNVADPANPSVVGRDTLRGLVTDVTISDNFAFVANVSCGMQVFDITYPADPDSISRYPVPGSAAKIAVKDSLAFLVDGGDLKWNADIESSPCWPTFTEEGPFPGDFQIVNVSDPTAPTLVGFYPLSGPVTKVAASGNYVYALNSEHDGSVNAGADVTVVDVSDKENPEVVGTYITSGTGQRAVVVDDTLLFLAAGSGGLEIVNVADPTTPALVGQGTGGSGALDVIVRGNYAFVANSSSGVWIFDISDPEAPVNVSILPTPSIAAAVAVWSDYLYVVYISVYGIYGVQIYNVSDPENPVYVTTFAEDRMHGDVVISDGYLYLDRDIFDISEPENPVYVGRLPYGGQELVVVGNYVFVADGCVRVVDVSDPASPNEVAMGSTAGLGEGLAVNDGYVYVADHYNLTIFELQLPTDTNDPDPDLLPETFVLRQNYPNPFNPGTTIEYDLPRRADVKLTVYDVLGRQVVTLFDGIKPAGSHSVRWDGKDSEGNEVASGVYLYKIDAGDFFEARKMLLLK